MITLQQKVSSHTKWFHWILSESTGCSEWEPMKKVNFISLMNGDYWTAPTFCSSVGTSQMAKTQWERKWHIYKQQALTSIENSFGSYESYIPMF
jgi:hypothetical protein